MKALKKIELSEYLNYDVVLERYHCFNQKLETLYKDALSKNIILQYHKKDLMQYVNEQKGSLLDSPSENELYNEFKKKNNKLFIKKALFRTVLFLSLYSLHVAGRNIKTQETSNVINSILMLNSLSTDSNNDGILEIDTSVLNYINEYSNPADDKYFYNTNFIYRLSDYIKISDSRSFDIAMEKLGYDIVEIDSILYSKTGNITRISYIVEQKQYVDYTSLKFNTIEDVKEYLSSIYEYDTSDIMGVNIRYSEVRNLKEIRTIKKLKEDGSVIVEEPSNNIKHSLIKKIF